MEKLKQALANIESLIEEVESGYFIPKRFRKAPFTAELREAYCAYLREEAQSIRARLGGDKVTAAVTTAPKVVVAVASPTVH